MVNGMRPIHPGEILREEYLVPLGMTPAELAAALHVEPHVIDEIVLERRMVTAEIALRLARYFGGGAESWLNMQQTYDLKIVGQSLCDSIKLQVKPRAP
jgi:addiction module HigA family antidote